MLFATGRVTDGTINYTLTSIYMPQLYLEYHTTSMYTSPDNLLVSRQDDVSVRMMG